MFRFHFLLIVVLCCGGTVQPNLAADEKSKPTDSKSSPQLPDNFITVAPGFFSGAEPEGRAAFLQLKKLGVQVIISVDGKTPDVEIARELGLRYVHIPISYGELTAKSQLTLVRAATEIDVPLYVHCHHGKHRGPAAMAVLCQANSQLTKEQAVAYLRKARTSSEYVGLWKSVRDFKQPTPQTRLPELEETAQVNFLASNMAEMDRRIESLQTDLNSKTPIANAKQEKLQSTALLLHELVVESHRALTLQTNQKKQSSTEQANLLIAFKQHEKTVNTLREALTSRDNEGRWNKALDAVKQDCRRCHTQFRN